MHFSNKKKTKKYFEVEAGRYGSHLCSARQDLSLGADSAIIFFRLQHGASGPHHERAVKPLLDPGGGFISETQTATRRFQK
jgi:hypothetical protein